VFAFFALTAITKFGSDGLILHNNCYYNSSDNRTTHADELAFLPAT